MGALNLKQTRLNENFCAMVCQNILTAVLAFNRDKGDQYICSVLTLTSPTSERKAQ